VSTWQIVVVVGLVYLVLIAGLVSVLRDCSGRDRDYETRRPPPH
jgi:hypothetical protein